MRMSAEDVIFRDGTFDVVVLSRSIAYASDAVAVIREAIRTLKPGGRLVLFCRRRDLATRAEEAFLAELHAFVREQPIAVPDRFLTYPGSPIGATSSATLRDAGLERVAFGDVVTGGRAVDVRRLRPRDDALLAGSANRPRLRSAGAAASTSTGASACSCARSARTRFDTTTPTCSRPGSGPPLRRENLLDDSALIPGLASCGGDDRALVAFAGGEHGVARRRPRSARKRSPQRGRE